VSLSRKLCTRIWHFMIWSFPNTVINLNVLHKEHTQKKENRELTVGSGKGRNNILPCYHCIHDICVARFTLSLISFRKEKKKEKERECLTHNVGSSRMGGKSRTLNLYVSFPCSGCTIWRWYHNAINTTLPGLSEGTIDSYLRVFWKHDSSQQSTHTLLVSHIRTLPPPSTLQTSLSDIRHKSHVRARSKHTHTVRLLALGEEI
jgi:uncharacterized DUF497 family protein